MHFLGGNLSYNIERVLGMVCNLVSIVLISNSLAGVISQCTLYTE
jgi:hypothetical protein